MKKPLFFTALSTLILGLNAQITITNGNFLGVNETYTQGSDTLATFNNIAAGANQTWDFSSLAPHNEVAITGKDPATLAGSANHPNANFAIQQVSTENTTSIFINRSNSKIESVGLELAGLSIKLSNPQTLFTFPFTFGNTYSDDFHSEIVTAGFPPFDSIKVITHGSSTHNADAWGTLTTPLGTIPVIRLFATEITESSTFALSNGVWSPIGSANIDTSYRHSYFSNDPSTKFPVLEYDVDASGTNTPYASATYLSETQNPLAVLSSKEALKFMVFPNPTTDVIQVLSAAPVEQATLTDLNGKTVLSSTLNGNNTLQIGHLAQGAYTLSVLTNGAWTSQTIQKL